MYKYLKRLEIYYATIVEDINQTYSIGTINNSHNWNGIFII